jgi:hypothetical protein
VDIRGDGDSMPGSPGGYADGSAAATDLLRGAVDIHVHATPHITPRRLTAVEAAQQAADASMKGIVLVDNFGNSAGIANLVESLPGYDRIDVLGGVVLNHPVGLINLDAVEAAVNNGRGAAFVSLPTHHSRAAVEAEGRSQTEVDRAFAIGDRVPDDLAEVIELVAQHRIVLHTGHLYPRETRLVVDFAKSCGVESVVVPAHGLDRDDAFELARTGAYLELTCFFVTHAAKVPATHIDTTPTTLPSRTVSQYVELIRGVGADHFILSSDAGSWLLPPPVEALRMIVASLLTMGLSELEMHRMVVENPGRAYEHFLSRSGMAKATGRQIETSLSSHG